MSRYGRLSLVFAGNFCPILCICMDHVESASCVRHDIKEGEVKSVIFSYQPRLVNFFIFPITFPVFARTQHFDPHPLPGFGYSTSSKANPISMTTALLEVPKWLIIIRGIQLLFSVIVLGLSAYGVYWVAFNVSWQDTTLQTQ